MNSKEILNQIICFRLKEFYELYKNNKKNYNNQSYKSVLDLNYKVMKILIEKFQ